MDNTSIPANPAGGPLKGVRGQILTFKADPFLINEAESYDHYADGLIVMQDGVILEVGDYAAVSPKYPQLTDIDAYTDALIMPGFVDTHVHYVQSPMIGSFGDSLLSWLNQYTFPTESKFSNKDFADEVARIFFKEILAQGTTTANVFSTTFAESVDALFEESERYNCRTITGKVLQDRNLPDSLRDPDTRQSIVIAEELLRKWHHRGRQLYAVIPRFAPTSTPEQLTLAGELYQRYIDQGVYMHTHLDEVQSEIDWVTQLFPDSPNYTEVYNRFGLVDRLSVFAHCCIVRPEEWDLLHKAGCGIAHCPSSNLFLGDGEFKYWEAKEATRPVKTGIGTDVGGGTNFSVARQIGEAYKVGMLQSRGMSPLRGFYLATRGGAEALHLEHTIGSVAAGYEADLAVLDMRPSAFAEWRLQYTDDLPSRLFVLATLGLNNLNKATYVAGRKVYDRDREQNWMYAADLK